MPKIDRKHQRIFGESGPVNQFGQIGSQAADSARNTKDLTEIQSLEEYREGFYAISQGLGSTHAPYAPELNSLHFMHTRQMAYLMQAGVPEWDANTEYFADRSFVQWNGELFTAVTGDGTTPNVGNEPGAESAHWKKTIEDALEIGDITSQVADVLMPVGFTYLQLPGGGSPTDMSMPGTWANVSGEFNNRFMRIESDLSVDFDGGGLQAAQTNEVHTVEVVPEADCTQTMASIEVPENGASSCVKSLMLNPLIKEATHDHRLRFSKPGVQAQPENVTIRVWRRTV